MRKGRWNPPPPPQKIGFYPWELRNYRSTGSTEGTKGKDRRCNSPKRIIISSRKSGDYVRNLAGDTNEFATARIRGRFPETHCMQGGGESLATQHTESSPMPGSLCTVFQDREGAGSGIIISGPTIHSTTHSKHGHLRSTPCYVQRAEVTPEKKRQCSRQEKKGGRNSSHQ